MKKFIFSALLLLSFQGAFAQLDWSLLNKKYVEVFKLAELISHQTGKVSVSENDMTHIGIEQTAGIAVNFDRKLDGRETQGKFYRYYLGKSNSDSRTLLDKASTEVVLERYHELLSKLKTKLDADRETKVDELLNGLFSSF